MAADIEFMVDKEYQAIDFLFLVECIFSATRGTRGHFTSSGYCWHEGVGLRSQRQTCLSTISQPLND